MEKIIDVIFLKRIQLEENKSYLFFLSQKGKILKLVASGLEKPTSKNANNLWDYSLVTIEYFENRFQNGGKLKKVTLLKKNKNLSKEKFFFWEMVVNILLLKEEWRKESFVILSKIIEWNNFEYSKETKNELLYNKQQLLENGDKWEQILLLGQKNEFIYR